MPDAKKIKKTMKEMPLPQEVLSRFVFQKSEGNQPLEALTLIHQMDDLLSYEDRLSIMEEQGCSKAGRVDDEHRAFGDKHRAMALEEKIIQYKEWDSPTKMPMRYNGNGTITSSWGYKNDAGKYVCVCAAVKRLNKSNPDITDISLTYCGCCGGHVRHHLQNALDIQLKLIDVVSSPISSSGNDVCEFTFEIVTQTTP